VQQGFELLGEVVSEATIVGKVDQQIDVAVRAFLAAANRAEETEVEAPCRVAIWCSTSRRRRRSLRGGMADQTELQPFTVHNVAVW
jgi:hypothetical protein